MPRIGRYGEGGTFYWRNIGAINPLDSLVDHVPQEDFPARITFLKKIQRRAEQSRWSGCRLLPWSLSGFRLLFQDDQ